MRKFLQAASIVLLLLGCGNPGKDGRSTGPFLVVLGVAQDGGFPQAGCGKPCCVRAWQERKAGSLVSSLAIVDPAGSRSWLIDATPDFPEQLHRLQRLGPDSKPVDLEGIFLTHAHTGHYTGLVYLGREAIGSFGVAVYAMPRMQEFLRTNGPWDQLVRLENISLRPLAAGKAVRLGAGITITPLPVPHRDEYSETVGYRIRGPERTALYIPDIDKWERWEVSLEELIREVDVAFLDGTFYSGDELPGRDLSEIPHPLIRETVMRLEDLPEADKSKVRFIHLNHTNPAWIPASEARRFIEGNGFRVAAERERFPL